MNELLSTEQQIMPLISVLVGLLLPVFLERIAVFRTWPAIVKRVIPLLASCISGVFLYIAFFYDDPPFLHIPYALWNILLLSVFPCFTTATLLHGILYFPWYKERS